MNPISLDAIKLLVDLHNLQTSEDEKARMLRMVEKLVFIMEKDIDQAYSKYSAILK